jgi:hypothetical protein
MASEVHNSNTFNTFNAPSQKRDPSPLVEEMVQIKTMKGDAQEVHWFTKREALWIQAELNAIFGDEVRP